MGIVYTTFQRLGLSCIVDPDLGCGIRGSQVWSNGKSEISRRRVHILPSSFRNISSNGIYCQDGRAFASEVLVPMAAGGRSVAVLALLLVARGPGLAATDGEVYSLPH